MGVVGHCSCRQRGVGNRFARDRDGLARAAAPSFKVGVYGVVSLGDEVAGGGVL